MNMLKITALSISLATVTSGAAVAPALGLIAKHFANEGELLVKLIITLPSFFIIISSMVFAKISNVLNIKSIAIIGFLLFIIGGVAPYFLENIYYILIARAILGLGVGFLMPLSTSLLGYLFPKSEQTKLMSLSGMCNQLSAVFTVGLSGFLASISWQYSFLIYLFAIFMFVLCLIFLPNIKIGSKNISFDTRNAKYLIPIFVSAFIVQVLFYNFSNNFSIIYQEEGLIKSSLIGIVMSLNALCGAIASLNYSKIKAILGAKIRLVGGFCYIIAFSLFSIRMQGDYYIFNINLMLIFGILGAILNGIATGIIMPFLLSQISIKSKKINMAKNMALASICVYSGQFLSPFIDEIFLNIFSLHGARDNFLIALFIAIFLFIYNLRLKIKLK